MTVSRLYQPHTNCPEDHARRIGPGDWSMGSASTIGFIVQGDGRHTFRALCTACNEHSGAIPMAVIRRWYKAGIFVLTHFGTNSPFDYPTCCVRDCTQPGAEMHHFSPRNTFGIDADDWPVLPICRDHHREWHTRMDGYRWNAPAVVA